MAAQILTDLVNRLLDSNGNPVSGGSATFYLTGTTTLASVYDNSGLTTPLTNPVITNAAGLFVNASNQPCTIYLNPAITYRVVYQAANGTVLREVDPINPPRDDLATVDDLNDVNTTVNGVAARVTEAEADIAALNSTTSAETVARTAADVTLQDQIDEHANADVLGVTVRYKLRSTLDADLAHAAGILAFVYGDSTSTNNGLYEKQGASGAGSWERQTLTYQSALDEAQSALDDANAAVASIGMLSGYETELTGYTAVVIDDQYRVISGVIDGVEYTYAAQHQASVTADSLTTTSITTEDVVTPSVTYRGRADALLSGYLEALEDNQYRLIRGVTVGGKLVEPRTAYWPSSHFGSTYRVTCTDGNLRRITLSSGTSLELTDQNADRYPALTPDESGVHFQRDQGFGIWSDYYVSIAGGTASPVDCLPQLACWGDSMTQNVGYTSWVTRLSTSLDRTTYNGGIAGETSTQIKDRMVADTIHENWTVVIEAGRNDILTAGQATVLANIALMVAHLKALNKRYLVVSIFNTSGEPSGNGNYATIMACNAALSAAYGANYLDVRSWMIANGLAAAGLTATSQDTTDINNDVVPTSLRITSDTLHHNNDGTTAFAACVLDTIQTKGW